MGDMIGRKLNGRYRIEALVGRGGMADVYRAYDMRRNYPVAIKVLREDLAEDWEFVRRFRAEADVLARLAHQNIVRFYSFEQDGRIAFIVMDFVDGDTLRSRIFDAWRPLSPVEALEVLQPVAAALAFAHGEGIIHRDVKPGNIMFAANGRVLLSDFGIAKIADTATVTTLAPGTPAYMSPEQCRGERLDQRTDIYSLGIVLYEMLTGRRPFVGELAPNTIAGATQERVRWEQMHVDPPDPRACNPALTEALARVALRALAKDPSERFPSATALVHALETACAPNRVFGAAATAYSNISPPVQRQPQPVPLKGNERPSRPPKMLWAAVALFCAVAVIMVGAYVAGQGLRRRDKMAIAPTLTPTPASEIPAPTLLQATPIPIAAPAATIASVPSSTPTIPTTATSTPMPAPTGTATPMSTYSADRTPPEEAFIDGPQDQETVIGIFTVAGWSVDKGSGIARVEIWIDGQQEGEADYGFWRSDLASNAGFERQIDSRRHADGWHTVMARCVDYAGNITDVSRSLLFANGPTSSSSANSAINTETASPAVRSPTLQPQPHVTITRAANARTGPGTDYPIVTTLRDGTYPVVARNEAGTWWEIQLGDSTSWVFGEIVSVSATEAVGINRNVQPPPTPTPRPVIRTGVGGRIVFGHSEGGGSGLYIMSPDGSNQTRLMANPASSGAPAWSSDGTRLAFEAREGQRANIFIMNADGSGRRRITGNPVRDVEPSWSPDGRLVAFAGNQSAEAWQIAFIDVDGGDLRTVTNDPSVNGMPFWAPDGQRIGFTSWGRNGNYQEALYIINADGSNERMLVSGISRVGGVAWSPDGKRIAFDSDHEAKWSEIYIINEDGSGFRRITDNPGSIGGPSDPVISGGNLSPSWSPDGSRIVFASRRAARPGIYTMNPDGSDQVWLADGWGPQWLLR